MKIWLRVSRAACVLLGLILFTSQRGTFAQSNAPIQLPTAQRFTITAQTGGNLSAALPLADGSTLAAEGAALLRLIPSPTQTASLIIADRLDPGYGPILDMAQSVNGVIVLATQAMLVVEAAPNAPLRILGVTQTGGESLVVQGSTILVAAREAGVRRFQVDGTGAITHIASLPLSGEAVDLALSADGTRVFVAAQSAGIHIVSLLDPAQPHLERTLPDLAPAESVAVSGRLIVVGVQGRILIADPESSQPVIGKFAPLRQGKRLVAQDDYLYVADGLDGLKILWLPAPDRLVQVYGETDRLAVDLRVSGDTLYIVGADGLRILDVGNRYRPLQLSDLALPGIPTGLALAPDGRVFVSMDDAGVAVIDAQNLSQPSLRKVIPLPGPARAVAFDANTLYAAAGDAGLTVISAFPRSEVILTTLPLPGSATDLALNNSGLFVAAGESGVIGVDVTRPNLPIVGDIIAPDVGRSITNLTISGKRLFAVQGDSFVVADASQASQFGRLTRVIAPSSHIAVIGSTIYALDASQIAIFDAGASAEPIRLRTYRALSTTSHLTPAGNSLYASSLGTGPEISAISIQFPDAPYEQDNIGETGHSGRAALTQDGVILPANNGGLKLYAVTEGRALALFSQYVPVSDSTSIAISGSTLIAGGRDSWSALSMPQLQRLGGLSNDRLRVLAADGDYLVTSQESGSLQAYSIDDPARPLMLATMTTISPVMGLAIMPQAVLAADAQGLAILQRDTLITLRRVASPAPASDVAVQGNMAFLALTDGSLMVVDLGDLAGGVNLTGSASYSRPVDLFTAPDGTILAVADNIVSRYVPGSPPALVNIALLPDIAERGEFINDLFVGQGGSNGLTLVSGSALTGDVIAYNHMDTPSTDLALGWPISYAAYGNSGWGLIDLSSLSTGALVSSTHAHAILRRENTLFVLGDSLTAWDISRPTNPVQLDELTLASPGRGLDSASDGSLLLSLESGFAIVNWNGQSFTKSGTLILPGAADHAALVNGRAFLAMRDGGVLTIDTSDRANLQTLFTIASPLGRFAYDLLSPDTNHLLVSWEGGVDSFEITPLADALGPTVIAHFPLRDSAADKIAIDASGHRAAMAFADGHIVLLDLTNPSAPSITGQADLPSPDVGGLALSDQTLFAANGLCGVRSFGLTGPDLPELGFWRGYYAADIAMLSQDTIYVADGKRLAALRFDPSGAAVPPPVPQSPSPSHDARNVALSGALDWGPTPDSCDPVQYNVYFGQEANPRLLASGLTQPHLEMPNLSPLSLYLWQVEAADRQGDLTRGPLWRFTTVTADFPSVIPPSPPALLAWVEDHPEVSVTAASALAVLVGWSLWRLASTRRVVKPQAPPSRRRRDIPDWYSTKDDDSGN